MRAVLPIIGLVLFVIGVYSALTYHTPFYGILGFILGGIVTLVGFMVGRSRSRRCCSRPCACTCGQCCCRSKVPVAGS